ncbi:MAG: hypothetical protein NC311_17270 [Muribaculaceae bacterium]|nr:hypothetical protein [Lachnospiraceae bacterium]MCM1297294.1 hypothetical protein [Muribaculaceae bacterium]
MKLNIEGCRAYCKRKGITNYDQLAKELELSIEVIMLLEQGNGIDEDAVKDIYNKLGEKAVKEIIDFEKETLNGFKSKFIAIGSRLY